MKIALVLLMLIVMPSANAVDIMNQRDPNYLRAVERLNEARQAMERATQLVREAKVIYRIPELDYDRLLGDLSGVTSQFDAALIPEGSRRTHRVLYPDSIYFLPKEAQQ